MTFNQRSALKAVVKFAKREFREKKPLEGKVLRVKDVKKVTYGGPFPQQSVKINPNVYYIVLLDYGDHYRQYNFAKTGKLLDGVNIEKSSNKILTLEHSTKIIYHL
ncbi:MAG: hypothetical protein ACFFDC_11995 [Promethearchaeota archaeon]